MRPIVRTYKRYPNIIDELLNDHVVGGRVEKSCSPSSVAVNIKKTETEYEIHLSAPGLSKEELKVAVDNNVMTISHDHKTEEKSNDGVFIRKEFEVGSFNRSFELPENVDAESISARHENGILKIAIPKKEKVEIPVKDIEVK